MMISFVAADRPNLGLLNRFRKDICSYWYDLGLELLDDKVLLDDIQDCDVNTCTTKMFELWLERHTSVTWNDLLDALIQIELRDVANKIVATIPTFTNKSEYSGYVMIKVCVCVKI